LCIWRATRDETGVERMQQGDLVHQVAAASLLEGLEELRAGGGGVLGILAGKSAPPDGIR